MKLKRTLIAVLLVLFLASSRSPVISAKAQSPSLFNGTITYIGTDGNVYLTEGNGAIQQITFDAAITNNSGSPNSQIWYDCPYFIDENEKYISFTKRNTMDNHDKNIIFDMSSKKIILETPMKDNSCIYLNKDDSGFYYQVDESNIANTGDIIQKEYYQYLSGQTKPIFEFSTKSSWTYNLISSQNIAVFQEKPNEITIYNLSTHEYSHIGVPIEKILDTLWSFDNRIIVTSADDNKIISIDPQTSQVSTWNFAIDNAFIDNITNPEYYLVMGDKGDGTPTALYKVDLSGQSGKLIYMASEPATYRTFLSGSLITVLEGYPSKLVLLNQSGNPEVISTSADSDYQWSNDFTKIYYIQLTQTNSNSEMFQRELRVHDMQNGGDTKMFDLIPYDKSGGRTVAAPISWYFSDSISSQNGSGINSSNTSPSPSTPSPISTTESQFSVLPFPTGFPYILVLAIGGFGVVSLIAIGLGMAYWLTRRKRVAKRSINQIRPPVPYSQELQKGILLAKEKRFKDSFDILRELVKTESNNPEIWYYLGYNLINMGDFGNAEKCLLRAKQLGHQKADHALNWIKSNRPQ